MTKPGSSTQPSPRKSGDAGLKKPRARPVSCSPAIVAKICERLAKGESLLSVCRAHGMPARSSVIEWINANECGMGDSSARAFAAGYDALADQCLEIANTPCKGVERTIRADGTIETKELDMLGHRRLQIDTRLRLLGKWAPKKYGDRQILDHNITADTAAILMAARKRSSSGKQDV